MDVKLIVAAGKASKGAVSLKLPTVIGRSRQADLTVSHPMVSRRHCEVFDDGGQLNIRDLGSLNGTIVSGNRVSQAALRPNDEFTIGPLTFRAEYQYDGPIDTGNETPESPAPIVESTDAETPRIADTKEPAPAKDRIVWSSDEKLLEAAKAEADTAENEIEEPDEQFSAFLQGLRED